MGSVPSSRWRSSGATTETPGASWLLGPSAWPPERSLTENQHRPCSTDASDASTGHREQARRSASQRGTRPATQTGTELLTPGAPARDRGRLDAAATALMAGAAAASQRTNGV